MKHILGLDLGTNSIGWAVIKAENTDDKIELKGIEAAGSRIIPMDAAILGDFDRGNSVSQTKDRTRYRGVRRLRERYLLRRERLHRVLNVLNFLPEHYTSCLDRYGKFSKDTEPKLPWCKDTDGRMSFLFMNSFEEMLEDFRQRHPQLLGNDRKIPYDWTIYYLRKKALTHAITKEELAWILLQFNQKRGYYQLRGEDDDVQEDKHVEYIAQRVVRVEATDDKKGADIWYNVHLENGMIYRRSSRFPLDWEGKIKEFIVTTDLDNDGKPKVGKDGNIKRSFRAPEEDDWTLLKKKTEHDIDNKNKTIGCYIYDELLENPDQKIIGKLVRTIERKYYKQELIQILERQTEFIPELRDDNLYRQCVEELYPNNEAHRNNIAKPSFTNLFVNDILFYQRPLKSKKSLIANCPYEERVYQKDGQEVREPIKCIAKSNPLFQEIRLWQFVQNIKIFQREKVVSTSQFESCAETSKKKLETDVNVTDEFIKSEDDRVRLFEWLNDRPSIKQDKLLSDFFGIKKSKSEARYPYRWNYVEDKEYPCNETRAEILKCLDKCGISRDFLTKEREMSLWHILYSIDDKIEISKALRRYADKNNLSEEFVEVFAKIKPFKKEYGSYSEKAIKKLLSLMRMGKYWNEEAIDPKTKLRIERIITGECDDDIKISVREKTANLTDISSFKGMPLWLCCYIIYDRHSEAKEIDKWESPDDIDRYLRNFKQHSLRNPIVEQVITETLRTVRDIWKQVGTIDEIHVELGREMKNTAAERKRLTDQIQQNENTNMRIKTLLMEFMNPELGIENVRSYSPSQQEILRIYEENAINNLRKDDADYDFVTKISKTAQPSKSDITRYKCWLEQQYQSPYTGQNIPLSKLFTPAYEIEHIIPQSRYFDDSFTNKVICESAVNKLKGNQLAYEFIKNHRGQKVDIGGKTVEVFHEEEYLDFVKNHYSGTKLKKLLMDDIPDEFIERQMNDSRYISKVIKSLLSNIVREKLPDGGYELEATSKNLISCTGRITDTLKKDWGIEDVWNRIVLPRFERMNEITGKPVFTSVSREGHLIPSMPLELQKGYKKKRIDHRHHAMDAIVIACTTRNHVNLLNNEAAKSGNKTYRHQLSRLLRRVETITIYKDGAPKIQDVYKEFLAPWDGFAQDTYRALQNIIVSFKQNLRVINKTTNYYQRMEGGKKVLAKQEKGDSWAIRKAMHKETIYGEVNLRRIKTVSLKQALEIVDCIVNKDLRIKLTTLLERGYDYKRIKKYLDSNPDTWSDIDDKHIDVYYYTKDTNDRFFATRKGLVELFKEVKDTKKAKEKIESITDTGIQKILLAHLAAKGDDPEIAFSPDGIDELNRNIKVLNKGKSHHPILKVRVFEKADKYPVGQTGNKSSKFVEAAKGTNLFFAIFVSEKLNNKTGEIEKVRSYVTIPLNVMIGCQKKFGSSWKNNVEAYLKENNLVEADKKLLFILSPNDLVYLPTDAELKDGVNQYNIDRTRVYKMVKATGTNCFFTNANVATRIVDKVEYTSSNCMERAITGEMIKETCLPLLVDRLGNIINIGTNDI